MGNRNPHEFQSTEQRSTILFWRENINTLGHVDCAIIITEPAAADYQALHPEVQLRQNVRRQFAMHSE